MKVSRLISINQFFTLRKIGELKVKALAVVFINVHILKLIDNQLVNNTHQSLLNHKSKIE